MNHDKDKAACYDGEQRVRFLLENAHEAPLATLAGSTISLPTERRFASLESIQSYVDSVLAMSQVQDRYTVGPITVRERKGGDFAHYELGGIIAINTKPTAWSEGSRWAMREIVVLHEVAHHLTPHQGHNGLWRQAFAFLASECMAPEVGLALQVCWAESGVG